MNNKQWLLRDKQTSDGFERVGEGSKEKMGFDWMLKIGEDY